MTAGEYSIWRQFREKWGPLNPFMRADSAFARLASAMAQMWGVKGLKMEDFMPWPKKEPEPATPQEVFAFLKSTVRKKGK